MNKKRQREKLSNVVKKETLWRGRRTFIIGVPFDAEDKSRCVLWVVTMCLHRSIFTYRIIWRKRILCLRAKKS